jgi:hypothetical protein
MGARMKTVRLLALVAVGLSCGGPRKAPPGPPTPVTYFTARHTDTRFHTADHMLASIEMQISGEPFAELLDRNLEGYNRFLRETDLFTDPESGEQRRDPLGYGMAVESYEYSKYHMNMISFESGAGMSLMFGPLMNPSNVKGDAAFDLMVNRLQHLADQSHASGPPGINFVVQPPPSANPLNAYGWPGFWPQMGEWRSFDPSVQPAAGSTRGCSFEGGYAAAAMGRQTVGDYECGYNSLNLPNRDAQIERVLAPDALGYATWKQILWVINYWATMHDLDENLILEVADADLPQVGVPGNLVVGKFDDGTGTMVEGVPGVYLGDTILEGWQGLVMLEEMTNKAALLLRSLTTGDGVTLGGFPTTAAALDYDYAAPLRWWPSAVAVTETPTAPTPAEATKYFPQPTSFAIASATSRLRDLTALAGGYGTYYALTDAGNAEVGGLVSARATFDGDPFPTAGTDTSPRELALAVVKVALVNVDRLHFDAAHGVLVDTTTVEGGAIKRGTTVNTVDAAYAIVGLRTALRAITSALTLYSNDTPDTAGLPTALDGTKLAGAPGPLAARLVALIRAEADFLADQLTAPDGAVANSFDLAANARDAAPTLLASQSAAIRGLLEAYLATSDEKYRRRAVEIYADLERRFWMEDVRAFRTTAGVSDTLTYTPLQFAILEGALRQHWKLVARRPGSEREAADLLERLKRTFKLVVNGWDDANADETVRPEECTGAGLQLAERALTGEMSRPADQGDRDHDCVIEIAAAQRPASLAAELVLERRK